MTTHDQIYKRDSKGKLRVWYQQQEGNRYRTVAGLYDGNLVGSGWTTCIGKQGRSDVEQATFEIEAAYKHKLTREYHRTIKETDQGAHFFKPMLANKYETFAPGFAQPKLDGVRCIASKDGLFSRQGKPIPGAPHVFEALQPAFDLDPSLVLDGELYNHEFKDDFGELVSLVRKENPSPERLNEIREKVQYHVYDMPSHTGLFSDRSYSIERVLQGGHNFDGVGCDFIKFVETFEIHSADEYDDLHDRWLEEGYEGSMWRANTPYEQKRSKNLLKRKDFQDDEFEVVAIEEGQGNWAGVAKAVRCRLPDGRIFGAGIRGTRERAAGLLNETHKVVTVRYFALTPDGIPRFPVVTKFHGAERTL